MLSRIHRTFIVKSAQSYVAADQVLLDEIDWKLKTPSPDIFLAWEGWLLRVIEPLSHAKFLAHPLYAQYLHNRQAMSGV